MSREHGRVKYVAEAKPETVGWPTCCKVCGAPVVLHLRDRWRWMELGSHQPRVCPPTERTERHDAVEALRDSIDEIERLRAEVGRLRALVTEWAAADDAVALDRYSSDGAYTNAVDALRKGAGR